MPWIGCSKVIRGMEIGNGVHHAEPGDVTDEVTGDCSPAKDSGDPDAHVLDQPPVIREVAEEAEKPVDFDKCTWGHTRRCPSASEISLNLHPYPTLD